MSEQRKYHRLTKQADVDIVTEDAIIPCSLKNISLRGILACAPTQKAVQLKRVYRLTIRFNGITLQMNARNVFAQDNLLGFQFVEIDIDSLTLLKELLIANAESDTIVSSELHHWLNDCQRQD